MFEQKFAFSIVVFCSHAAISVWFLLFFRFLELDFFLNGFPNPFIVRSRPSFLYSQWKFFELYVRSCRAVFLFRRQEFYYDHMTSQPLQIFLLFIRSCNFNWFACATSFFTLSGASFFLFIWVNKFLVTRDIRHDDYLTLKLASLYCKSKR